MGQPYHCQARWKKEGLLATVSRRAWLQNRGVGVTYRLCSGYPEYEWLGAWCLGPPTGHHVYVGQSVWIVHGTHSHKGSCGLVG